VRLWCADDDPIADLDSVLPDVESPPVRVDVAGPKSCRLAPAQPAVREHQYQRAEVAIGDRQLADLVVGQVGVRLLALPGHFHAAGRSREDPSVADSDVEDRGEHTVGADHHRRAAPITHLGDPGADFAVTDVGDGGRTPARLDL